MARLNYSDKISFSQTIGEFMEQNKTELETNGFLVSSRIKEQKEMNKQYIVEDAKQEKMKAELVKQTEITVSALDKAYRYASTNTDAMVGVLGKDTPLAKHLRELRDQMHHSSKK